MTTAVRGRLVSNDGQQPEPGIRVAGDAETAQERLLKHTHTTFSDENEWNG